MQIVAQGAQDRYLTVDPQITYFKKHHRRHTNFAVESIEQMFNGTATSGGKVTATISRNGDLVHRMWLEIVTDDKLLTGESAYDLIDNVTVEIGGTQVDRHYGAWMKLADDLRCPAGKRTALSTLTDGETAVKTVRIPLSFWFCRDPGQSLPLIALQYHEVKISVSFKAAHNGSTDSTVTSAKLFVDYIYLDTVERQQFASQDHEYLIEQVQTSGTEVIDATVANTTATKKINLYYNHPVKEIAWLLTGEKNQNAPTLDTAKLQLNGHDRFVERDATYFREVQQVQHHSNAYNPTTKTINVGATDAFTYSFCLEPEDHHPSGSCNFSRIDNAVLVLKTGGVAAAAAGTVEVFGVNYNVLRIKSGMGGLAYSN